jgi:hypothetical protein
VTLADRAPGTRLAYLLPAMLRISGLILGIALALTPARAPAAPAELRCSEWQRLGPEQKEARIGERISSVERSPELRQIRIERGELHRCLEAETDHIRDSLDDACAEGLEADLEALEWIFRDYVATCISETDDSQL